VLTRDTYTGPGAADRNRHLVISGLAVIYTAFLLWAAGLHYLLLSCIVYAPGVILFARTRHEQRRTLFSSAERVLFLVVAAGAVVGIVMLITGGITI
jgi:arginine:ornithine antiporter/lysine permease